MKWAALPEDYAGIFLYFFRSVARARPSSEKESFGGSRRGGEDQSLRNFSHGICKRGLLHAVAS